MITIPKDSGYSALEWLFHRPTCMCCFLDALGHFFIIFGGRLSVFVGPLISLFWTSGDAALGFKASVDPSLVLSRLCAIPQIHLWCRTCQPLDGQHGGRSRSLPNLLHANNLDTRLHCTSSIARVKMLLS